MGSSFVLGNVKTLILYSHFKNKGFTDVCLQRNQSRDSITQSFVVDDMASRSLYLAQKPLRQGDILKCYAVTRDARRQCVSKIST